MVTRYIKILYYSKSFTGINSQKPNKLVPNITPILTDINIEAICPKTHW